MVNQAGSSSSTSTATNGATSNGQTHGRQQQQQHFATRLVHEGSAASEETGAVQPPISLSTTFKQSAVGVTKGYEYTRSLNPNRLAFETLVASLEIPPPPRESPASRGPATGNGQLDNEQNHHHHQRHHHNLTAEQRAQPENLPNALAFASGSAITQAIVSTLVKSGGHIVTVNDVYGGTYRYLTKVAVNAGIETTFVEMSAAENVDDMEEHCKTVANRIALAFRPETELVWIETPTNPTLRLVDIQLVADIAHRRGAVVVVDNTFLSPYYQQPLLLGADIVTHSVTKYINGFSDVLMGVLVTPRADLLEKLRFYQNASGAVPSAFDCWLAQRGAKTLALRMQQHGVNALAVARWLTQQEWVTEVIYPGLEGDSRKAARHLAWKQLSPVAKEKIVELGYSEQSGFPYGGMVSFRLKTSSVVGQQQQGQEEKEDGDGDAVSAATVSSNFLSALNVFTLAESLGGVESLAELPALMTHASLSEEARQELGINDELIRLSCGIEDIRDLEADLAQAWSVAKKQQA